MKAGEKAVKTVFPVPAAFRWAILRLAFLFSPEKTRK